MADNAAGHVGAQRRFWLISASRRMMSASDGGQVTMTNTTNESRRDEESALNDGADFSSLIRLLLCFVSLLLLLPLTTSNDALTIANRQSPISENHSLFCSVLTQKLANIAAGKLSQVAATALS